jgi:hypothetical protein
MSLPLLEKEHNIITVIVVFIQNITLYFFAPEISFHMIIIVGNTSIVLKSLTPVLLFLVLTHH